MPVDSRAELSPPAVAVVSIVIVVGLLTFALLRSDDGKWDFTAIEDLGWIYHDEMTTVFMRDWVNGEYKQCSTYNAIQKSLCSFVAKE
jgi:hypothetical protein